MRLIDADELLDKIVNVPSKVAEETFYDKETDLLTGSAYRQNEIIDIVNAMPTVEQKHGHWIEIEKDVMGLKRYKCSNCGETDDDYTEPIFCKHCGSANSRTTKIAEVTKNETY